MKVFQNELDQNRVGTNFWPFPDYTESVVLAASTAQEVAVPAAAAGGFVRIASTDVAYVKSVAAGSHATVPSGATSDGSSSIMVFAGFHSLFSLEGVTSISVISPNTPTVTLSFFARKK
jgi:hypothetical protein